MRRSRPRAGGEWTHPGNATRDRRAGSDDAWRSVGERPLIRPFEVGRDDGGFDAPRRDGRVVRNYGGRRFFREESRKDAAQSEARAAPSGILARCGRLPVLHVRLHRHLCRSVCVTRGSDARVHGTHANPRRFDERGGEPYGPEADQEAGPERASHDANNSNELACLPVRHRIVNANVLAHHDGEGGMVRITEHPRCHYHPAMIALSSEPG